MPANSAMLRTSPFLWPFSRISASVSLAIVIWPSAMAIRWVSDLPEISTIWGLPLSSKWVSLLIPYPTSLLAEGLITMCSLPWQYHHVPSETHQLKSILPRRVPFVPDHRWNEAHFQQWQCDQRGCPASTFPLWPDLFSWCASCGY